MVGNTKKKKSIYYLLNIKCTIIVSQDNVNEACKVLDKALENISLEHINSSALFRLKNTLEASGQTFKYKIVSNNSKVSIIII